MTKQKKTEKTIYGNNLPIIGFTHAVLLCCLKYVPSFRLRLKLKRQILGIKNNARQLASDSNITEQLLMNALRLSSVSGLSEPVDKAAKVLLPESARKIYEKCKKQVNEELTREEQDELARQ